MSLVIGFMALLDVTIVNVAIPSIQAGLHLGGDRAVGGVRLRARLRPPVRALRAA